MTSDPGWYPQPDGTERYWDGSRWTRCARPPESSAAQPETTFELYPGAIAPRDAPTSPTSGVAPATMPAASPSRRGWLIAAAAAVVLVAGSLVLRPSQDVEVAVPPAPTPTVTLTVVAESAPTPTPTVTETVTVAPTPAQPSEPEPEAEETADTVEPLTDEPHEPTTFTMPTLVGMNLQDAQNLLQEYGSRTLEQQDATGRGRYQVRDRNWKVCSQQPRAGRVVSPDTVVVLAAVKLEERCP